MLPPTQNLKWTQGYSHPTGLVRQRVSQEEKDRTSRATTRRPPASPASICVMCAYPVGETRHSPSSSPAAASKPAETIGKALIRDAYLQVGKKIRTDYEFRSKLYRDWHDDFLEGVNVFCIAHSMLGPWNVHRAASIRTTAMSTDGRRLQPETWTFSARFHGSKWATWVKGAPLVSVYGYVQDGRVIIECPLRTISYRHLETC